MRAVVVALLVIDDSNHHSDRRAGRHAERHAGRHGGASDRASDRASDVAWDYQSHLLLSIAWYSGLLGAAYISDLRSLDLGQLRRLVRRLVLLVYA